MKNAGLLDRIEKAGNRLPNPTLLFVWLCGVVLVLSALASGLNLKANHPVTNEVVSASNLLSREGLHRMLAETVSNFVTFAPVGTVLVAMLGIAVAEHSGLLAAVLRVTVLRAPRKLLTFSIVLAGVLSSLAADTGYVVLIPLAAMAFATAGRPPLLGIAAAFAGVSGGYSANLLIGPLDAILAGLSTEAAALVDPGYEVNAAGNYYFMVVSTLLISLTGTWVTERWVGRRLQGGAEDVRVPSPLSPGEVRGLTGVGLFTLIYISLLLLGLLPSDGVLRDPDTGSMLRSPFIQGIVTLIALYAAVAGLLYGRISGQYRKRGEWIEGMEKHMATMGSYLVLMFFAAQFVNYFAWSNLGSILAIQGAVWLQAVKLHPTLLLASFIFLAAGINLFIGSASAKWALIAPVFVPMLLLSGITPEATQMAYRIGDSSTNIITPLMPYFGVIVAFARQYDKKSGIGSIVAMMLPYSLAFLVAWTILLLVWVQAGWPLGPGVSVMAAGGG